MHCASSMRPAACSQRPVHYTLTRDVPRTRPCGAHALVVQFSRSSLAGRPLARHSHKPCSPSRRVFVTSASAARTSRGQKPDFVPIAAPQVHNPFQISWPSIVKGLLIFPLILLPLFLPRPAVAARGRPTKSVEVWQTNAHRRPLEVWPTSSDSRSAESQQFSEVKRPGAHTASKNKHEHDGHESSAAGAFAEAPRQHTTVTEPRHHSKPVEEVQQSAEKASESPAARIAVFVASGVALLYLLQTAQSRRAKARDDMQSQTYRQQAEPDEREPRDGPRFAATVAAPSTEVAGRPLPVEERQAQANRDIAAAKARQAAFASQGQQQFTDADIAKPAKPDFAIKRDPLPSDATATLALDDAKTPSGEEAATWPSTDKWGKPTPGPSISDVVDTSKVQEKDVDSRKAADDSPTGTFVLDTVVAKPQKVKSRFGIKLDTEAKAEPSPGKVTDKSKLESSKQPLDDDSPTGTLVPALNASKPQDAKSRFGIKSSRFGLKSSQADKPKGLFAFKPGSAEKPQTLPQTTAFAALTQEDAKPDSKSWLGRPLSSGASRQQLSADKPVFGVRKQQPTTKAAQISLQPRQGKFQFGIKRDESKQAEPKKEQPKKNEDQKDARTKPSDDIDPPAASKQAMAPKPDTSKPILSQGRADLARPTKEQQASINTQDASEKQLKPAVSAQDAVKSFKPDLDDEEAETSEADEPAEDTSTSEPVFFTRRRSTLQPRDADEQNAQNRAQADAIGRIKAERKRQQQVEQLEASLAGPDEADDDDKPPGGVRRPSKPPPDDPDTRKPPFYVRRSSLQPRDADEQNAQIRAQAAAIADAKAKSRDRQPVASSGVSSDLAGAIYSPRAPSESKPGQQQQQPPPSKQLQTSAAQQTASPSKQLPPSGQQKVPTSRQLPEQSQQQPQQQPKVLSEQNQTSGLAKGLANASTSAQPKPVSPEPAKAAGPSKPSTVSSQPALAPSQPSPKPLPAASSSTAGSLAPAQQQQQQNPFQGLVSAFQGLLGGAGKGEAAPAKKPQRAKTPPRPSSARQAQAPPSKAARRMAASNQALAAGKPRTEVPVRRYEQVSLPGDVTQFVRSKGLRAPLLLLAGLAASAAQTAEPLWPVQKDAKLRSATQSQEDEEPVDWERFRKYDVFKDLLGAAAANPEAQGSPLRDLANAVPEEGVPKYDFLRDALQGAANEPTTGQAKSGSFLNISRPEGPDGKALRSKYDPFHTLLEGAAAEPAQASRNPGLDPLGALLGDAKEPHTPIQTKYDPFQALFKAEDPTGSSAPLDPLKGVLQQLQQPTAPDEPTKVNLNPFKGLFKAAAEGPGRDAAPLDPLGNLLKSLRQPSDRSGQSQKYDPIQALFNAPGPSEDPPAWDPVGASFEDNKEPWQPIKTKYDPFQAAFSSETPSGDAPLDPLPHVMRGIKARAQLAARDRSSQPGNNPRLDKYDPLPQLLNSEPATGSVASFDPVGNLLKSSTVTIPGVRILPDPGIAQGTDTKGRTSVAGRAPAGQQQAVRAPAGEHDARQRGGKQAGQTVDEADRPSEWAGYRYNPYSGDPLTPEEEEEYGSQAAGNAPEAYSAKRGSDGGSGKPLFISANAFRRPQAVSYAVKRHAPAQAQALGSSALVPTVSINGVGGAMAEMSPVVSWDAVAHLEFL